MKLSTDAPEQHMAIIAIACLFMFLSLISSLKSKPVDNGISEAEQQLIAEGPRFSNPEMTWYEKAFCRGFQRASFCSYRFLHPMNDMIKERGFIMEEAPPKQNAAVNYRGRLSGNRAISGRITLDQNN